MNAKEFAVELRSEIQDIKSKHNVDAIKCDNLIAYLTKAIEDPSSEIDPVRLEKYKAELQVWIEQNKAQRAQDIEMFRSVIMIGQNALKSAVLMNGGASIALLAFLGGASNRYDHSIPLFARSLLIFVCGVFFDVAASGVTYLSQWCYGTYEKLRNPGHIFNCIVIVLVLTSYGFFIWGALEAYGAFIS